MENFGSSCRNDWYLDPDITYLNHGTVGAPPKAVVEHQQSLMVAIERNPARFMLRELADPFAESETPKRLRRAANEVAAFVGLGPGDDLLFVDNITAGANAVLRSFPFRAGDGLAVTSLGYGGITNVARYVAERSDLALTTIELPLPGAPAHEFVERIAAGLTPATRILVVDHLTSATALVLPLREIAEVCHARGVLVLADGAHVPGNIELDVAALGVDWYVANLHKWAWAPRACGFLWAAPEHRASLHPTVISWGLGHGLTAEFDLLGTHDPTAALTAPFAIDQLRTYRGGGAMHHNRSLAHRTGPHLAERFGTAFDTPAEMIGSMVSVRLPTALMPDDAGRVQDALLERRIEAPIIPLGDGLTVRVSCQVYCDIDDIDRFADAVDELRS